MSRIVVFLITVLSAIGFLGCAKYQTIPMCAPFDTAKERTVYETNISTTEDVRAYSFSLEYVDNRSVEERKRDVKNPHYRLEDTTIGKIIGGLGSVRKAGSKLLLKLTITQISEPLKPMKYRVGTSQYDVDEKGNGHFNLIAIKLGETIEVISNIGVHRSESHGMARDGSNEPAWRKSIAFAMLEKGDYHIKLEVLEASPEFEKIRTNFTITKTYFGK